MPQQAPDVTRQLAAAARAIRFASLPPEVVYLARQCLLDWLGVTLAGVDEPLARLLRDEAEFEGSNPQATLIGRGEMVSLVQAALVNGATSHALDYDDVHMGMSGHPSVPVIPALLALAEHRQASGAEFIAAFVAGFEVECRVGALVMPGHYATGFHSTGTLGTFGAAAASAHLMGLDEKQWLNALGIAAAQASGLKAMFGTMCKPLHAGKAAANGLLAAQLAARGFTSNPAALEAAQGFAATQTSTPNPERTLAGLGEEFAIRGALFKYHAACYGTHETIEGMLRLRDSTGVRPEDVADVRLSVPPGNLNMCNISEPATALEGKFSLRFTAALALSGGPTNDEAFTDDAVRRPDLVALRDRVTVAAGEPRGTTVELELRDGRRLSEHVNLDIPAADLDLQWDRLAAKFDALAAPVLGSTGATTLRTAVSRLDHVAAMGEITALAVPHFVGAAR